jgi:hypothetical protein
VPGGALSSDVGRSSSIDEQSGGEVGGDMSRSDR